MGLFSDKPKYPRKPRGGILPKPPKKSVLPGAKRGRKSKKSLADKVWNA